MEPHNDHDSKPDQAARREEAAPGAVAPSLTSSGAMTLSGRVQIELVWGWREALSSWDVTIKPSDAGKPVSMWLRLDETRRVSHGVDQITVRHHRASDPQSRAVHVLSVQLPLDESTAIHRAIGHWHPPAPASDPSGESPPPSGQEGDS